MDVPFCMQKVPASKAVSNRLVMGVIRFHCLDSAVLYAKNRRLSCHGALRPLAMANSMYAAPTARPVAAPKALPATPKAGIPKCPKIST